MKLLLFSMVMICSVMGESITADSCNNITDADAHGRYPRVRDHASKSTENRLRRTNLQCFAFSDGVLGTFEKHGLYNKDICLETTLQAMKQDPTTTIRNVVTLPGVFSIPRMGQKREANLG